MVAYWRIIESDVAQFLIERGFDPEKNNYFVKVWYHVIGECYYNTFRFDSEQACESYWRGLTRDDVIKYYTNQYASLN